MAAFPDIRYARNGDIHIAYQTLGQGPPDLLRVTSGPASHLEHQWNEPTAARMLRRCASFSRLVMFDNRGAGLSDPVTAAGVPTVDQQMDDVRAVLDEVGVSRAVLLGYLGGCAATMLFAATFPERVESLILWGPYARLLVDDDYPMGVTPEVVDQVVALTLQSWGTGASAPVFAPSMAGNAVFQSWMAQMERLTASPGTAAAMTRQWFDLDVRRILPTIRVPTLVLARTEQPFFSVEHSRFVAEHIPQARYVEFPGKDLHYFIGDSDPIMDATEEFVTGGHRRSPQDRFLGTVLFTDIVDSTVTAERVGDRRWRDLLESFTRFLERQLERFGGRLVDTAGDGALSLFDSPARAIAAAQAIVDGVRALGLEIRAGLHTGEMERVNEGGVGGISVHIGARVCALAGAGEILVSRTIKDLVAGSPIRLESRGVHQLKGVAEAWEVFAVVTDP